MFGAKLSARIWNFLGLRRPCALTAEEALLCAPNLGR